MRVTLVRLIVLLAVAATAGAGYYLVQRLPERKQEFPVAQVRRGDLVVRSYVRGELRAVRTVTLTAPNLGRTTQVTRLAVTGDMARRKDLIVEFDDSELQSTLEDDALEVAQIEERIKKAEAEQKIRRSQDQVDLLRARFAVRRAELEVKRNELISTIDARKNVLSLEEAKRTLAKLEEDVKSRLVQGEAELAVLREQRRKEQLELNRTKTRLDQTRLLAPITGLVAIQQNRSEGRGFTGGMQMPDIREGDQVSPGSTIAEILDLSELEVFARVSEIERASLQEGQEVLLRLDALPGQIVPAKIKSLSATASSSFFSSDPVKRFDCFFAVEMKELLALAGGAPAQIERILATAKENAKQFAAAATPAAPMPEMMAGRQGRGGREGAPDGERRGPRQGGGGPREPGDRGPGGGAQGSDEDRQRLRQAMQQALGGRNMQDIPQEERQKLFAQMREKMGGAGGPQMAPGGPGGRDRGARGAQGGPAFVPFEGGPRGGRGGPGRDEDADMGSLSLRQSGGGQPFTAEEREKAELPPPPDDGSLMDLLLRPGLLAEADIIVEKVANAVYVPQQGVFDKEGKKVVYVRTGATFEQRTVKLGKRTESQAVVLEGLREGEWIALEDPQVSASARPKKDKAPAGGQQPVLPGSGAGAGRPGP